MMNNKQIGIIITSFAFLLALVIYFFNRALSQIVNTSCDHGPTCPMWGSITFHTNLTIALTIIVLLIGLYLVFFGEKIKQEKKQKTKTTIPKNLEPEEKQIMQIIIKENGTMFQSKIVEETKLNKVKITRILDKLEGKGLIERKRRGMTNVVILKHK
ncbi:MarR family transcriptional regulator [Candidatus Woesearchaeota archaeon]|nr:MarR family transcriptional regulator [Candidatus Woesearchaeota archaeon]